MTPSTTHPGTGRPIPNVRAFSRFNPDGHYRLPQRFNVGTCTILVDTTEPRLTMTSTWDLMAGTANNVVAQCVHIHGNGGENKEVGFNTIVLNEANLDPTIRDGWQRCVNLINMQQNLDTFTQCLLETMTREAESDQARSRTSRTPQRRARTIDDISVP